MAQIYEKNRLLPGIDEAAYSQAEGLRSSEIKVAATRSIAHWRAYQQASRKDTPALALGRLIHRAVLEPEVYQATCVVQPDFGNLRTAKAQAEVASWRQSLGKDAIVMTQQDAEIVAGIRASISAHQTAKTLLQRGKAEHSAFWHDKHHNLPLKCRPDFVTHDNLILDLKTTQDARRESFAKDLIKYQYHLSAALYCQGMEACGFGKVEHFLIVAIEKTPPYALCVYDLDNDTMRAGTLWLSEGLRRIRHALDTGSQDTGFADVDLLEQPRWAPKPQCFLCGQEGCEAECT